MRINILSCAFLFCGLLFSSSLLAEAVPGKPAPLFTLMGADQQQHSLEEYRGKYIVLEWFNPKCPFVKKHYDTKNMQSLQKRYTDKGVVWLAITSSAKGKEGFIKPKTGSKVIAKHEMPVTQLLFDQAGTVGKLYGARTTPHMFVIDPKLTVIYAGAIDDNSSAKSETVAVAKNHVAQALDEALAGKPVSVATSEPYGCSVKYAE